MKGWPKPYFSGTKSDIGRLTDDKIYCVYIAPNKELIEEHAKQGGFPANKISEVRTMIDPTTAET